MQSSRPETLTTARIACAALALFVALAVPTASQGQQKGRERIDGVTNFGRVTENYFRGGEVTPEGVERLHRLGVRTIVDLRDEPSPGEPEACERLGIRYHKFPMSGHATPDRATLDTVLAIIRDAKEPVYVHCSAGKHRAGTVCALYRMEEQGWSAAEAWAEQASYGFGPPEEHPELYAFVYGEGPRAVAAARPVAARASRSDRDASQKAKIRSSDDDDDDDDDDGEDDDGEDDGGDDGDRASVVAVSAPATPELRAAPASVAPRPAAGTAVASSLSAAAPYIPLDEAIRRSRAGGGQGEIVKVDLEFDAARSLVTWDITFSTGAEHEIDAATGEQLAVKQRAASKMAVLAPLGPDARSLASYLTFQQVLGAAEKQAGQAVMEMELKRIQGRAEVMYEVAFADGSTLYYDARSGAPITSF